MITESYTLLTRVPLFKDFDGFYADDLWEKDLSMHLKYISDFRIVCPVENSNSKTDSLKKVHYLTDKQVTSLSVDRGWASVAFNFIPNFIRVFSSVRRSQLVHTGCAGWAFPLAYYVLLLRPFLTFKWINVVESSFWIKPISGRISARQQIEHYVNEFLVKACVRHSDARIFTQDWYRQRYLGSHSASMVNTAVWIDDKDFRSESDLDTSEISAVTARFIFPARLIPDKGVDVVLAAVQRWDELFGMTVGPVVRVDIIGVGPLAELCRGFILKRSPKSRLQMEFLGAVPYGPSFFKLLRTYSAAIVANRQAEQARIVFDVMAQGIPCVATRTTGNLAIIEDGSTGALFPIDDVDALANLIEKASRNPVWLCTLGRNALSAARGFSHSSMHREREAFLRQVLSLS